MSGSEKEIDLLAPISSSPTPSPFIDLIGMQVTHCDHEGAKAELKLRAELLNGYSIGHGGVLMTMLDVVMARAARAADPLAGAGEVCRPAATAKLETRFLRPAMLGMLYAEAKVLEVSEAQAITKGWIVNEQGKKLAQATGTFKYLKVSRAV